MISTVHPGERIPLSTSSTCPNCHESRLLVYRVRRPKRSPEIAYRYRACSECGRRTVTREKTVAVGEPRVIREAER